MAFRAVFLVGHMGSGKTSVGRALSRRLGWRFQDLDERIETREGRTVQQIFQQLGETGFREAEHKALREVIGDLKGSGGIVVALGGGTLAQVGNLGLIEQAPTITAWLDAPPEELWRRCQQDETPRPLARDETAFRSLHEARRGEYSKAGWRVDTQGKSVEEVAGELATALERNSVQEK